MPVYLITWSQRIFFESYVEAPDEEQAEINAYAGKDFMFIELEPTENLFIDRVEEISEDEAKDLLEGEDDV